MIRFKLYKAYVTEILSNTETICGLDELFPEEQRQFSAIGRAYIFLLNASNRLASFCRTCMVLNHGQNQVTKGPLGSNTHAQFILYTISFPSADQAVQRIRHQEDVSGGLYRAWCLPTNGFLSRGNKGRSSFWRQRFLPSGRFNRNVFSKLECFHNWKVSGKGKRKRRSTR